VTQLCAAISASDSAVRCHISQSHTNATSWSASYNQMIKNSWPLWNQNHNH